MKGDDKKTDAKADDAKADDAKAADSKAATGGNKQPEKVEVLSTPIAKTHTTFYN